MEILKNKTAIITGAASGIGKAAALLLAKEGAQVVVSDIDEEKGNEAVKEISDNGGKALFIKADTSKPENHEALVNLTIEKFGSLDIAVNNAGIGGPLELTGNYPIDGWKNVIDINLSGVFYGLRYQIPAMEEKGGSIINMASILGAVGTPNSPAYVSAKHGVIGLTKTAALEYAAKNIRVNSIGPGYIRTPLVENNLDEETIGQLAGMHPLGRLGKPEEVAELVLWLASDKSSFVTGTYYPVDGGYLAQ